jgi:hypothetical protein
MQEKYQRLGLIAEKQAKEKNRRKKRNSLGCREEAGEVPKVRLNSRKAI